MSSRVVAVAWVSLAPTVTSQGSSPGEVTDRLPSLPADVTTVRPDAHAASSAAESGLKKYGIGASVPSERFTTRMPSGSSFTTTQPIAWIRVDNEVDPSAPATFTATTVAPGATPVWRTGPAALAVPSPAMRPAMKVPWPYRSTPSPSPEKSGPCTSRAPWRSDVALTPVSINATATPAPDVSDQSDSGCIAASCASVPDVALAALKLALVACTDTSGVTRTSRSCARAASPTSSTCAATPSTSPRVASTRPSTTATAVRAAEVVAAWTMTARSRAVRTVPEAAPAKTMVVTSAAAVADEARHGRGSCRVPSPAFMSAPAVG